MALFSSFWPLRGHLSWPLTSDQRSKLKILYLAWCMSKYMFLGSRSSKIAFVYHFDLLEVTSHDLLPPIRGQKTKFLILHDICLSICFLDLGVQIWHCFFYHFDLSVWHITFHDLCSEAKTQNSSFAMLYGKTNIFWGSNNALFFQFSLFGMMYVKIYVFGI